MKYLHPHLDLCFEEGPAVPMPESSPQYSEPSPITLHKLEGQPPTLSSATPTDIAQFALCPRRYFLDRLAGLNDWPSQHPSSGALELGTAVHQILAGQSVECDSAEARELASVFLESPQASELRDAKWVEHEFDIVFAIDDLVLHGQIDLCYESQAGEIMIIDYKTDRKISDHYDTQMAIYREALRRLYPGKAIRSYLYFLRSNQVLEARSELDRNLLKRFAAGHSFPTQAGDYCHRCPHFAQACPIRILPPESQSTDESIT